MAAFDAGSHLTGNSVSTLSWTHTPVGTPSGVYVGIFSRRSAAVVGDQPSAAPTYGGTAMTLVGTVTDATSLIRWTWYYLPSPASGAQTVSVTFGGTSQLGCGGVAYSVTGDSGANPSASLASAAGNSTTASVTPVAPGASDLVLFAAASNTASAGFTTGAGMSAGQVQVFVDNSGNNDWDADYRPGSSGSAALTHTVTTGTWFGSTINVPGAAASSASVASVVIPNRNVGPMALRRRIRRVPVLQPTAATTIFNDSGSGTITLTGTGTESQSHSIAAAGTVTLSGSSTQSFTHSGSGAGTITLSGAGTEAAVFSDSRSGTITLTGTSSQSQTHTASAAGTVTLAGSSAQSQSHTASATGTVTLSGFGSENFVPPGFVAPTGTAYDQTPEIIVQRLPH